jgi:hypothetical protein
MAAIKKAKYIFPDYWFAKSSNQIKNNDDDDDTDDIVEISNLIYANVDKFSDNPLLFIPTIKSTKSKLTAIIVIGK